MQCNGLGNSIWKWLQKVKHKTLFRIARLIGTCAMHVHCMYILHFEPVFNKIITGDPCMCIYTCLLPGFILQSKHTRNCFSTFKKCRSQKQSKKTVKWCRATSSTTLNTETSLWLFCETFTRCFSRQPRYEIWSSAHTCTFGWWSDIALRTSTWSSGDQRSDQRRKEKAKEKVLYSLCL